MQQLFSQHYFALFFIIALGIIIGHIKIKGISLDISAVIFVALLLGHWGVKIPADFRQIGSVLFIFTIGIQAGPGFFDSFHKQGLHLILTTICIIFCGAFITVLLGTIFNIDPKIAVGLFTGALTSTPGLAAAIESTNSPLASIGYGIAYPFGVIGVILFVRLLPRIIKVDLKEAKTAYLNLSKQKYPDIINQNFIVENQNIHNKTIGELHIRTMTGATISRIMHDETAITPNPNTTLQLGDFVKAVGSEQALERFKFLVGSPSEKEIPLSEEYDVQWILVSNKKVSNSTLQSLHLLENYNATVTRIRRSGIDIAPNPNNQIRFGDKLMVACNKENMKQVIELLGNNDKRLSETDFLPIALGIVLGVLVGKLSLPFAGFNFSLGLTGGVLATALILSRIGKTGPVIWTMSGPANQLLRSLGLLFFLTAVGTEAGSHISSTYQQFGPKLFFIGAFITVIPMGAACFLGQKIFKLNFLTLLGTITGGMTSTPGLAAIDPLTDCNAPQIAYATVYPVALVCVIICAQIIGLFINLIVT